MARKSGAVGMAEGIAGKSFQRASHPVTVPTMPGGMARNDAGVIPVISPLREPNFLESFRPQDGSCEMLSSAYVAFNQAENPIEHEI